MVKGTRLITHRPCTRHVTVFKPIGMQDWTQQQDTTAIIKNKWTILSQKVCLPPVSDNATIWQFWIFARLSACRYEKKQTGNLGIHETVLHYYLMGGLQVVHKAESKITHFTQSKNLFCTEQEISRAPTVFKPDCQIPIPEGGKKTFLTRYYIGITLNSPQHSCSLNPSPANK